MTCYYPTPAFVTANPNAEGKKHVSFNPTPGHNSFLLPCGKCLGCRLDRSRDWAARCTHEAQLHEFKCFLTLTYDEKNLPEDRSLDHAHFQKFMHDLRQHKQFEGIRISYLMCGEYGETTLRPHYHAIIFGIDFPDKKHYTTRRNHRIFTSALLDKIWSRGECKIGNVTPESAAYVARYAVKNSGPLFPHGNYTWLNQDTGELVQVKPEYGRMSTRPAIGKLWYEKFASDVHTYDHVILKGKEFKPPRYYDKLLQRNHPERFAEIKAKRMQQGQTPSATWNNSTARLRVREEVKQSKIKSLKRDLP